MRLAQAIRVKLVRTWRSCEGSGSLVDGGFASGKREHIYFVPKCSSRRDSSPPKSKNEISFAPVPKTRQDVVRYWGEEGGLVLAVAEPVDH